MGGDGREWEGMGRSVEWKVKSQSVGVKCEDHRVNDAQNKIIEMSRRRKIVKYYAFICK